MFYDLKPDELKNYLPKREEPKDFSSFWSDTLKETRSIPMTSKFEKVDYGLKTVETYDVTYSGYNGQEIKGWYIKPANVTGKIPCVVEFIGYGGGRSFPVDWLLWSAAGYAHFIMDTRGQGSAWTPGDTPDIESDGTSPFHPGFMTKGILSPKTYYYKRVFVDGLRAVDLVKSLPEVDKDKVILTGGSQGGGITIAVGYLVQDVAAIMPDVPYLCGYRAATEVTDADPYAEISRYLKTHRDKVESTFKTLSYFDGINFSAHSKAPALFSAGLMDIICPPRTVFGAYNHYAGKKEIKIYDYNNHEGGGVYHNVEKLKFAAKIVG
jgi:cephalosporin-C deacetylase